MRLLELVRCSFDVLLYSLKKKRFAFLDFKRNTFIIEKNGKYRKTWKRKKSSVIAPPR